MIRVVFFGTPHVSNLALEALISDPRFDVIGVITQPPKPVGRSSEPQISPVHAQALIHGIPVLSPVRVIREMEVLRIINADIHVVVAYGQILSKELVNLPKYGTVNIHPSLLPRWRGAAPVPATILSGDPTTGVTIMQMDEKMDHGPILDSVTYDIKNESTGELLNILMEMGAKRLPDVLDQFVSGDLKGTPQIDLDATYCKTLSRDKGRIDWSAPLDETSRMIRAYNPWPGTWCEVQIGKKWQRLKIIKAHLEIPFLPSINSMSNMLNISDGITHVGNLIIDELQLEGKKSISGGIFAKTRRNTVIPIR
jgi:methionyl-tRNA formyltransferase